MTTGTLRLANYRRMIAARGPRFALEFFREAHLFDLRFGTDTASELAHEEFDASLEGVDHGVYYGASWTSEVRRQFDDLRRRLGDDFAAHSLIDVGCGKGKVVLVWGQELLRAGIRQKVVGIDYYPPLIEVARMNLAKVPHVEGTDFWCGDVRDFDYEGLGTPLIMWAFNPFDAHVFRELANRLESVPTILVYNNPVHWAELVKDGWRPLWETASPVSDHPRTRTAILCNAVHPWSS